MKTFGIRILLVSLVALLALGCASGPKSSTNPTVTLSQTSQLRDVRVDIAGGLPLEFRLDIDNQADYAIRLLMVEVESVGDSGSYGLKRVRHAFDRTIPARSADAVDFRAWVYLLQSGTAGDVNNPVMLRGSAQFDTPEGVVRRNFVGRGQ